MAKLKSILNERMAKDVFKDAENALTKTTGGRKFDKRYVKDYLKSMERLARKNPGQFVKDYGDFEAGDWIEDVRYNMANESVNEASVPAKFGDEVFKVPPSKMNRDHVLKVAKKYKVDPKLAIKYVNQVGRLKLKEGKLNEITLKGKAAGSWIENWGAGGRVNINNMIYKSLGKGKWKGPNGEKLSWKDVAAKATELGDKRVFFEGKGLNESMIGIQTKANFKPNTLKGALEKAGIKGFQMNRLSVTMTALKLDKKDFEAAKKIIDSIPTAKVQMAKESKLNLKDLVSEVYNKKAKDQATKIAKSLGGEYATKWTGVGCYFSFPIKDFDDYATPGGITQNMGLLKKNMAIATKQAEKAGNKIEKIDGVEDWEVSEKSPTGVYGKVWLWVMID